MQKINALFLSDIHLGSRACNADLLVDVLKYYDVKHIIINGDFIDFWQLSSVSGYWSRKHYNVLRILFKKARDGCKVTVTTGNHDEALREFVPFTLDNISIVNQFSHESIKYGNILFLHGDVFDFVIQSNKWLAKIGTLLYDVLLRTNVLVNFVRKLFGLDYWSLSKYLKTQTKKKFKILQNFDTSIVEYAKKNGFSAVSAGHIHIPDMKWIDNILYLNTGDMCETGSFIIEHLDGEIELITNFKGTRNG